MAKCNPVGNIKDKFWEIALLFYVVRFQFAILLTALLACVIVSIEYCVAPFFIFNARL
jgi:hypothetical protein